jgi:hypothetical protein
MGVSDRWAKLYEKVGREKHHRDEEVLRNEAEGRAAASVEKQYAELATSVMSSIKAAAVARGRELSGQTGTEVIVTFPADAPNEQVARSATEMQFLKIALERAVVYLYSARSPSKLPALHLLSAVEQLKPAKARTKRESMRVTSGASPTRERVVSKLLGRITPEGNGYVVRARSVDGDVGVLDEDAIVFDAFELLVKLWKRTRKDARDT